MIWLILSLSCRRERKKSTYKNLWERESYKSRKNKLLLNISLRRQVAVKRIKWRYVCVGDNAHYLYLNFLFWHSFFLGKVLFRFFVYGENISSKESLKILVQIFLLVYFQLITPFDSTYQSWNKINSTYGVNSIL